MIKQLSAAEPWAAARTGHMVTIAAPAPPGPWPLLVWPGRGLGILDTHLPAFYEAIATVMKQPTYPHALGSRAASAWSAVRLDAEEGFAYLSGPARSGRTAIGYRPARAVTVAVADVRQLRIRIAAYLGESGRL
ncbi:hypothetical protein HFP15_39525 [Amycolatopsis sp. K13G38]|uniref:Uncharacterized protein n=1 Tax=Amycolatopsis acididurans TaxID=2724524 RepID=A0ABX1JGP4_9PSEU|nr:hypothetical protein [Amycolatopsis acididurans]NKQ58952.1 hypothetical protein [Amycolatopsis acididurans]